MFTEMFTRTKEIASSAFSTVKRWGKQATCAVAAAAGITLAEPALAGGPQIPDVGIDVGAMAQNMGTALGSTLGEIIPVALGFVIVSIGVVWLVKWLRRS